MQCLSENIKAKKKKKKKKKTRILEQIWSKSVKK